MNRRWRHVVVHHRAPLTPNQRRRRDVAIGFFVIIGLTAASPWLAGVAIGAVLAALYIHSRRHP